MATCSRADLPGFCISYIFPSRATKWDLLGLLIATPPSVNAEVLRKNTRAVSRVVWLHLTQSLFLIILMNDLLFPFYHVTFLLLSPAGKRLSKGSLGLNVLFVLDIGHDLFRNV